VGAFISERARRVTRGHEAVARLRDRLDQPWPSRVVADLAPQVRDVDVDHAIEHLVGPPRHRFEQLLAREHRTGTPGKGD
jgi:hypothetical protein